MCNRVGSKESLTRPGGGSLGKDFDLCGILRGALEIFRLCRCLFVCQVLTGRGSLRCAFYISGTSHIMSASTPRASMCGTANLPVTGQSLDAVTPLSRHPSVSAMGSVMDTPSTSDMLCNSSGNRRVLHTRPPPALKTPRRPCLGLGAQRHILGCRSLCCRTLCLRNDQRSPAPRQIGLSADQSRQFQHPSTVSTHLSSC